MGFKLLNSNLGALQGVNGRRITVSGSALTLTGSRAEEDCCTEQGSESAVKGSDIRPAVCCH